MAIQNRSNMSAGGAAIDDSSTWNKHIAFTSLLLLIIYLFIGVIAYSFVFQHKSFLRSLYMTVVTVTSVGYGDETPTTDASKIFACFFAYTGIIIVSIALGIICEKLIKYQLHIFRISAHKRNHTATGEFEPPMKSRRKRIINKILHTMGPLIITISVGAAFVGHFENWTVVDSIYWCVMTSTTVGYGDLYPTKNVTLWFSVFFIPIAVFTTGNGMGGIVNYYVVRKLRESNMRLVERDVTLEDLEMMDQDGDQKIDLLEYVEFMLLRMKKVDRRLITKLHSRFKELDRDGSGKIDKADIDMIFNNESE